MLRQAIERLSMMLDEWPSLMKMARDARRGTTDGAIEQLRILRSMLPRLADSAASVEDAAAAHDAGSAPVSAALAERLSTICSMLCASRSVEKASVEAR